ncbi:cadherin-like beta sandwich domain-containing protein [uncultured Clostridium sp.]|uniref:cadherin-like beta sandwich domain-containing protein n=1 Tax=uncultured Clostridium sp. TaxID=59620 RepID=UPI0025E8C3B7|nr:cadherin-like beta sandwich domain-containing protein [uncultured Clostridium sp.]
MKERLKFKKILSYFLIFAMAFSFMQLGQAKSASAASVSSMIEGFDFYVGNSTTGRPLGVDQDTSGNYVIRGIDMAKTYALIPKTGYDLVNVECDSDYASAIKSAYGSNSMWTITNIKNYEAFSIKVTVKDPQGNISKAIPILLEIKEVESLMFSRLEVTIDNDTPLSYGYNDKSSDGIYQVGPLPSTAQKATIQMYDASNNVMSFTVNGSTNKTFNLVGGDNEFELKVTNSGYSRIYKLVIEKKGEAKLKSLVPSAGSLSPAFNSDTTDYKITVPTTQDKIAFTPTAVDNSSTIKVKKVTVASGNKSQDISLDEGDNKITITVTSRSGDSTVYTVVVTRTEKFRSADLKSLKLTSGSLSPTFNKGVYEYTAIVENSVSSVGVIPVAEDAEATIRVEGKKLPSGATSPYISLDEGGNVINVTVTDTKGNENTYVIMITRKYSKNNVNLSSLTVTDGTFSPKFDPEIYAYSVKVPRSVEEVRIKFESQNEKAKISVNGAEYQSGQQTDKIKLNLGANTVTVKVVAEDGKTTTNYVLSIIRDKVQGTISDWVLVGGEWMFYNGDGIPAKNQWIKYDNQWYHVDINGYMNKNGWLFDGGEWYYLDPNGIMLHGWIKDTGYWYYFRENGPMVSNTWAQLDGNWYFFNQYGQMQTGWLLYLGKWYYMDDHGVMQKGWITYDKNKYYLDDDGTMRNGWLYNGKTWYYFDESGRMITGWQTIGNRTYYFDSKGAMKTGMLFLDGRWINLDSL